jgi:archaellum component FlaC
METNPAEQGGIPAQPVVPPLMGQPSAQSVVPPSNIKIKPGLIIAIVGGVVAVAAAVLVVFLVVIPMFSVSREDYNEAYEFSRDVSDECSTVGGSYSYTNGSATTIKNKVSDVKKELKDCSEAVKKLADSKAVKRDGKAKELHEAFTKEYDKYKKSSDIAVEALESIFLPIAEVAKSSSTADAMLEYATNLNSKLSKVGDLKYDENKTLLTGMKKAVSSLEKAVKKYKAAYDAYKNDWRNNDYPSLTDAGYYDAQDELSDATKAWSDKVSDLSKDGEPSKSLGKLRDYLIEKS